MILAIDPGAKGALAFFRPDQGTLELIDTPTAPILRLRGCRLLPYAYTDETSSAFFLLKRVQALPQSFQSWQFVPHHWRAGAGLVCWSLYKGNTPSTDAAKARMAFLPATRRAFLLCDRQAAHKVYVRHGWRFPQQTPENCGDFGFLLALHLHNRSRSFQDRPAPSTPLLARSLGAMCKTASHFAAIPFCS